MAKICSHEPPPPCDELLHRHHCPRRAFPADLLSYQEYQIWWHQRLMAKGLEPPAGLLLPGDRLYKFGCVVGIIFVLLLATEFSDILNLRCYHCGWDRPFAGSMDYWRRSSVSVREDSKKRRALMVMSEEREPYQYSCRLRVNLYATGQFPPK